MVPLQVETSLTSPSSIEKLKAIGTVLIGGAPLSDSLHTALSKEVIAAWQTFGMTETVSHIALAPIRTEELIYEALPGVEIGVSENQCLWIQSAMSGSEKIQTNDMIELRSKNSFVWLGRADFVVNSGGIKLFPEQLEKKINTWMTDRYPGVPYFFFGEADARFGERLVLYVEGEASQFHLEVLDEGLKKILGKYEVPKKINLLSRFTYTETGKINRPVTAKKP
jgi:O-succinylbenzoic acid--CoA ligase